MKKLDEYLKVSEAAELLGVSANTLRKWADEGRVRSSVNPANGYRLFRKDDLEKFLSDIAKSKPKKPR